MSQYLEDDDCEDQGIVSTTHCMRFDCQTWERSIVIRPRLVKRFGFWVCPKCGAAQRLLNADMTHPRSRR